jgi:hypothetical protein
MNKICRFTFDDGSVILDIEGQREDQIINLFNNYRKEYERGSFDDSFLAYLSYEKIKFKELKFDIDLKG